MEDPLRGVIDTMACAVPTSRLHRRIASDDDRQTEVLYDQMEACDVER